MSERRELGHFLLFFFPRPNSDIIEVKKRKWFPKAANNIGRRVPGALSADVSTKVLGVFYIWHGARRGEMHKVQIVSFDIISLAVRVWSISCLIDFFFLSFADLFFWPRCTYKDSGGVEDERMEMWNGLRSRELTPYVNKAAAGRRIYMYAEICTLGRVEIV